MPLNGVMLMKQAGVAEEAEAAARAAAALQCVRLAPAVTATQGWPGSSRKPWAAPPEKWAGIQPGNEG